MQVLCHLWSAVFQSTLFNHVQMWNLVKSKNTYLLSDRLTSCWTEVQNRYSQSFWGDFCFGELPSHSLSSTFPLKARNWGCSKAEHYLTLDGQYRYVPSFPLPLTVTFFTQVLGTTWANIFTSSSFTYKQLQSPIQSLQCHSWIQTGMDLFHNWSKNA